MTFSELRDLVRAQIIVDEHTDAYENTDLNDALWQASVEIAAACDFPRTIASDTVAADATEIAAPEDCVGVRSLSIDGDDLKAVEIHHLMRMRGGSSRPSRYFNFDPRRGGTIQIAPATTGGTYSLEYTQALTRPEAASFDAAEPWSGNLARFHSLIAYRAAVPLFQMDERENEVEHWRQEYNQRALELAAFLRHTDVTGLMIEASMGSRSAA